MLIVTLSCLAQARVPCAVCVLFATAGSLSAAPPDSDVCKAGTAVPLHCSAPCSYWLLISPHQFLLNEQSTARGIIVTIRTPGSCEAAEGDRRAHTPRIKVLLAAGCRGRKTSTRNGCSNTENEGNCGEFKVGVRGLRSSALPAQPASFGAGAVHSLQLDSSQLPHYCPGLYLGHMPTCANHWGKRGWDSADWFRQIGLTKQALCDVRGRGGMDPEWAGWVYSFCVSSKQTTTNLLAYNNTSTISISVEQESGCGSPGPLLRVPPAELKVSAQAMFSLEPWGPLSSVLVVGRIRFLCHRTEVLVTLLAGLGWLSASKAYLPSGPCHRAPSPHSLAVCSFQASRIPLSDCLHLWPPNPLVRVHLITSLVVNSKSAYQGP